MKLCFSLLLSMFACFIASANERTFVGSTPAHKVVRNFLQISLTDSIDFIRWKLEIGSGIFKLQCRYGLAKPGTPGFSNEKTVAFEGGLSKSENYYHLVHGGEKLSILQINRNVLHFLDVNKGMLSGNGGYSYALNNTQPVKANEYNIQAVQMRLKSPLVFEGRTPCRDLPLLLGLNKSEACNKMKWYFLLYSDSLTGKPSYFLMGGTGYRKETMGRGHWQIITMAGGRIIYRLYSDKWSRSLDLLKGDDNVLFFIDAGGELLIGNEDFSYTLNRRKEEYPSRQ